MNADVGSLSAYAKCSPLLTREMSKVQQLESHARDLLAENERFVSRWNELMPWIDLTSSSGTGSRYLYFKQ